MSTYFRRLQERCRELGIEKCSGKGFNTKRREELIAEAEGKKIEEKQKKKPKQTKLAPVLSTMKDLRQRCKDFGIEKCSGKGMTAEKLRNLIEEEERATANRSSSENAVRLLNPRIYRIIRNEMGDEQWPLLEKDLERLNERDEDKRVLEDLFNSWIPPLSEGWRTYLNRYPFLTNLFPLLFPMDIVAPIFASGGRIEDLHKNDITPEIISSLETLRDAQILQELHPSLTEATENTLRKAIEEKDYGSISWHMVALRNKPSIIEKIFKEVDMNPVFLDARDEELIRTFLLYVAPSTFYLEEAIHEGNAPLVRILLEDGRVDPSADDNRLVYIAAGRFRSEVLQIFLNDPRVDPSKPYNNPLESAKKYNEESMNILLKDPRVQRQIQKEEEQESLKERYLPPEWSLSEMARRSKITKEEEEKESKAFIESFIDHVHPYIDIDKGEEESMKKELDSLKENNRSALFLSYIEKGDKEGFLSLYYLSNDSYRIYPTLVRIISRYAPPEPFIQFLLILAQNNEQMREGLPNLTLIPLLRSREEALALAYHITQSVDLPQVPLSLSIEKGDVGYVVWSLVQEELGLPSETITNEHLLLAIESNNFRIISLLLEDERIDATFEVFLPLRMAIERENVDLVELLLANERMDPSLLSDEIFSLAETIGNKEILDLLND